MRKLVEIANPVPGGQKFTSENKAKEYIARGRAYMTKDGKLKFKAKYQKGIYLKNQIS